MRCTSCNKPFYPTLSYRYNKPYFSELCSSCVSKFRQGYANSHEHVQGLQEEPLVMVATIGSLKVERL